MARPEKPEADKRVFIIRLRVTLSEKSHIWQTAKDVGLGPSDYMRGSILQIKPARTVPTPDRELLLKYLAELGKQGSNFNQIARRANQTQDGDGYGDIDAPLFNHILRQNDELKTKILNLLAR